MNGMKRLISIEYLRAFSILYIVGFWHLFSYTRAFPGYYNSFTFVFTKVVLGLFIMISGFLIASSAKRSVSLIHFYKSRLVRIYPLYALAVILFYLCGLNDATTSIKALMLISMFYGPVPVTLWFITLLVLFYLLTPILLKFVESPAKYLFFIVAIFALIIVSQAIFGTLNYRLLFYLPPYCVGIYCSRHGLRTRGVNIKFALLLCFLWLILSFIGMDSDALVLLKIILIILSCSYLIFLISCLNEDKFKRLNIISLLSYSSFAMYLFHRPIYSTFRGLFFPESLPLQVLYLMAICLLAVVIISWGVQRLYDMGCLAISKYCGPG
jgi:peptidoglycan/LPS O-acetylase OafA/YrhL